jgi:tetratricopeptide (TPR) repeat protein
VLIVIKHNLQNTCLEHHQSLALCLLVSLVSVRLLGKAAFQLGEHAQAEAAYRKAVAVDPSLLLAWKGLSELLNSQSAVTPAYIETQEKLV